eukprot:gene9096-6389_t
MNLQLYSWAVQHLEVETASPDLSSDLREVVLVRCELMLVVNEIELNNYMLSMAVSSSGRGPSHERANAVIAKWRGPLAVVVSGETISVNCFNEMMDGVQPGFLVCFILFSSGAGRWPVITVRQSPHASSPCVARLTRIHASTRVPWGFIVSATEATVENGLLGLRHAEILLPVQNGHIVVPLVEESVRIGRMTSNDIQLSRNPCISSVHCSLSIMRVRMGGSGSASTESTTETDHLVVVFSDFSRNGCRINNAPVGKGKSHAPLKSGDLIVLMDAGARTSEYNLSFRFYKKEDFHENDDPHEVLDVPSAAPPDTDKHYSAGLIERNERKRKFWLISSWNAAAHVERMHAHNVEDFYLLEKDVPLGVGAFGKVFRAALRPVASAAPGFPPLPSPFPSVLEWTEEEVQRQRAAYIEAKKYVPSSDLMKARRNAAERMLGKHATPRKRSRQQEPVCDMVASDAVFYHLAVKVIEKHRLWFDDAPASLNLVLGGKRVAITAAEKHLIMDLMQLETPLEVEAEQMEQNFLENEWKRLPSSLTFSQESQQVNKIVNQRKQYKESEAGIEATRNELLQKLSPRAREMYRKARRASERRKCEANILISVSHPNIVRLYEVFDNGSELALVMEQATGGEVFDLLQPPKLSSTQKGSPASIPRSSHVGGPLPEFVVKIIITQVVEAIVYLHSMGIVHRDLKLENLLLQRPTNIRQLVLLQCETLRHKIRELLAKRDILDAFFQPSQQRQGQQPGQDRRIANPLSPFLWPVVQITDFGLSRILDRDPAQNDVYTRNELKTQCGTPNYSAPEVLNKTLRPNKVGYGAAVDMFSVGVIAFALLTNRLPFPPAKAANGTSASVDYSAPLCFQRLRRADCSPSVSSARLPVPLAATLPVTLQPEQHDEARTPGCSQWEREALAIARLSDQPMSSADYAVLLSKIDSALQHFSDEPSLDIDVCMGSSRSDGQSSFTDLPDVSPLGRDFLASLLTPYPNRRLCAADALRHPWLHECSHA